MHEGLSPLNILDLYLTYLLVSFTSAGPLEHLIAEQPCLHLPL